MHRRRSKLHLLFKKPDWRLLGMGIVCVIAFGVLIIRFYKLQVIDYVMYQEDLKANVERKVIVKAERGEIYDRYGYPLATNKAIQNIYYTAQIDLNNTKLNSLLLKLIQLLENNGDSCFDELPISYQQPFVYTKKTNFINQFTYTIPYIDETQRKIISTYTAQELIDYLKVQFDIPNGLSPKIMRELIGLRCQIYSCKYRKYEKVLLATDISLNTLSYLKENNETFANLTVQADELRSYPLGSMASSFLGYISFINNEQYEILKDKGYLPEEKVGQMGIEKSLEDLLRGKNGQCQIEVDNMGRVVRTLKEVPSQKGKDVYLTIDANLQKGIYKAVEMRLDEVLIKKLQAPETYGITGKDLLISLVRCHAIDFTKELPYTQKLKNHIRKAYNNVDPLMQEQVTEEAILGDWLVEKTDNTLIDEVLLVLQEQNVLVINGTFKGQVLEGKAVNLNKFFIEMLQSGILHAGQMAIDPFSAVAIMVDVKTGEILSLVDYPSYDNNQVVSNYTSYLEKVNEDDRSLLWQRALKTLKAPGSTFKMITALAGLEEGCITPDTTINDVGIYKEAGKPYPRCWYYTANGKGHGKLDLKGALAASCNYYFYEVAHRLAAKEQGKNMSVLSKYIDLFGFTEKTGVELEEKAPLASTPDIVSRNRLKTLIGEIIQANETFVEELSRKGQVDLIKVLDLGASEDIIKGKNYEENLKIQLEPILQEKFKNKYKALLDESFLEFKKYMQKGGIQLEAKIIAQVLQEEDVTQRKEVAQSVFYNLLDDAVGTSLNNEIEKVVNAIDRNTFLDAYEKALTSAYRESIRQGQKEESRALKLKIEALNSDEFIYRKEVILKVRRNLLNTIVNNLLDGVELNWTEGIAVRTAIGQGYNAFSPLQVVRYIAALANGQELMPLTLVKDAVVHEGKPLEISPNNVKAVQEGMLAVTQDEDGTAKGQFDNFDFQVAAKTGTAQEGEHEHSYVVAFAPYEKPEVALIVAIYNADGLGTYSTLIANDMLQNYFGLQDKQENITLANTWME